MWMSSVYLWWKTSIKHLKKKKKKSHTELTALKGIDERQIYPSIAWGELNKLYQL